MAIINIKDIPEPKTVKIVDLSEDSINEIAEAVVRKIKEQEQRQILDGVEIVRCEDCKYSEHWYGDKSRCFLWSKTGIDFFEDGYCSYGKRREDDD